MAKLNEQFRRMQVLAGIITEGQLNENEITTEGFNDFNVVGWTARIKEIAKEMNYLVALASDQKIGERAAAEAAKNGERKAFLLDPNAGENRIVASFALDQNEKDKNKQFIQKKLIDVYKSDANVKVAEETYGDTVMTVIIEEK
jgi:hypothetical protein